MLSPLGRVPPSLTKRYEPVFTRLAVVKGSASAGFISTIKATILAPSSGLKKPLQKEPAALPDAAVRQERHQTTSSPHFGDSQERWILMIC